MLDVMLTMLFYFQAEDGIRDADVTGVQTCALPICLPDFAEHFAADAGLARRAPGHHASRRGQDVDAEAAHNRPDLQDSDVAPAAGLRDAAQARDRAALVRGVLQEDAKGLAHPALIHQLKGGDA